LAGSKKLSDPLQQLAALPSLGLVSAQMLIDAGIRDARTLRKLGTMACYRRLRFHFGKRVTVNFAYALECAIRDLHWRALEPERQAEIKAATLQVARELEEAARS
jgi:hypothetical protein